MLCRRIAGFLAVAVMSSVAGAANITWIGGNADWVEGAANNPNWNPNDEPDADDTAIFNTANAVNMASSNSVLGLTMSAGIDLSTNTQDLDVNGLVQLSGSNTNLIVSGAASLLTADAVTINNMANLELDGGAMQVIEEAGVGLLDINAGGELLGFGSVNMNDGVVGATTLIVNDGAITAQRAPAVLFGAPQVGTLSITGSDVDARIDLDGAAEGGAVIVRRNQTLDINIVLADGFGGAMSLFHDSTLDMASAWILNGGGTINVDNGFVDGSFPNPDIPAGASIIDGATLTQSGGTIHVVDADGTLQFDAPFIMNDGEFINEGHTIFNANATIANAATFTMGTSGSDLTVGPNADVSISQLSFNLDGNAPGTEITVGHAASLMLVLGDYENDAATNVFDGVINLNGGDLSITTGDAEFVMDGTLNMSNTGPAPNWTGEPLDIGNDLGALDADWNLLTGGLYTIASAVDFNADADVSLVAGANVHFEGVVNFDTVNAANNAEFTGPGQIVFLNAVNVNEAVTLNMPGGFVILDGIDGTGEFVNVDAPLTINTGGISDFGNDNAVGVNTLDINSLAGTGALTVNLDDPNAEWTLHAEGVMNLVNDGGGSTLLAGSDVNLNGTVNVTGGVGISARVDMAGSINVAAGSTLTFTGGSAADPNRLMGGTIDGPGGFLVASLRGLRGFGTINSGVNYTGSGELLADDGELTINGPVIDAGTIGTADADGVLNVVNAWNTSAMDNVFIIGGELKGGTVTVANANGIQGYGTITSRVINNSKLVATDGATLLVQTVGSNNDWDGASNMGALEALSGDLEMVDTTGPVPPVRPFGGSVRAIDDNRVFANGFALDFNPGSSLTLENEATYRASSSTDIGGTVSIGAGADATIQVANNFFLTFETSSATTLNGDVTLINNNIIIEQGAVFSGAGALTIPDGSHLVADNQAEIDVLLDMQGAFRPGNSQGIGRVELLDMQMASSSELFVELTGTGLNQFDRLVADGDVIVDGYLNIDIDEVSPDVSFVPALGNTFNIITGNSVSGEFDFADVSGMPAGLAFHINYLANAVQLQVVSEPLFSADFDDDGDVDPTDLAIWDGAYDLNQLGDADGDNDSDGNDFLMWQQQVGSAPAVTAATAVPEPATAALFVLALIAAANFARRLPSGSR